MVVSLYVYVSVCVCNSDLLIEGHICTNKYVNAGVCTMQFTYSATISQACYGDLFTSNAVVVYIIIPDFSDDPAACSESHGLHPANFDQQHLKLLTAKLYAEK